MRIRTLLCIKSADGREGGTMYFYECFIALVFFILGCIFTTVFFERKEKRRGSNKNRKI